MLPNKIAPWPQGERPGASLSLQQLVIVDLTREHLSASAIAIHLGVTSSSVHQQRRRISAKLGLPRDEARRRRIAAILLSSA